MLIELEAVKNVARSFCGNVWRKDQKIVENTLNVLECTNIRRFVRSPGDWYILGFYFPVAELL